MTDRTLSVEQLHDTLRALYRELEAATRERFNRSLPLADALLNNRWERAAALGFGEGASIYDSALVLGDVQVGEQTWIGPGVLLDGSGGGLRIGRWVSISAGVHVYTHDTVLRSLSGGQVPAHRAPVSIGDFCHLGAHSIIRAGVSIGHQCVIGANSLVTRDVPDRTIVGGSPARPIGHVEGDGPDVRMVLTKPVSS